MLWVLHTGRAWTDGLDFDIIWKKYIQFYIKKPHIPAPSKLKASADDQFKIVTIVFMFFGMVENMVGKVGNAGY